jgi:hypothetical protein
MDREGQTVTAGRSLAGQLGRVGDRQHLGA